MTCLASSLAYTASLFSHRGGLLFPPRPPHASNPVVHRPIAFQTTGRYELNRGGTVWSGASSAQRPAAPSTGRGLCCGLLPFLLVPGRQERGVEPHAARRDTARLRWRVDQSLKPSGACACTRTSTAPFDPARRQDPRSLGCQS